MRNRRIATLMAAFVSTLIFLPQLGHAADAPAPPGVMDTYLCNLNPGKDMGDLMAARDYYLKQAEKAGVTPPDAYVWSLFKGIAPAQLVWHNIYESTQAWAAATDANAGNADMASVLPRFDTVVTCNSVMSTVRPISQREAGDRLASVLISSSACNVRDDITQQDLGDLTAHMSGVLGEMGDKAPLATFMASPMTPGADAPDLFVFAAHENATSWAEFGKQLNTTDQGGMLRRHFGATLDCTSSLWNSQQVIGGGS